MAAAIEAFATLGYQKANINQISLSAGYSKGTIYNYFPSKRELMLALIDSIAVNHFDHIASQVREVLEADRRRARLLSASRLPPE